VVAEYDAAKAWVSSADKRLAAEEKAEAARVACERMMETA